MWVCRWVCVLGDALLFGVFFLVDQVRELVASVELAEIFLDCSVKLKADPVLYHHPGPLVVSTSAAFSVAFSCKAI